MNDVIPEGHSLSVTYAEAMKPVYWEYRHSAIGELIVSAVRIAPRKWKVLYGCTGELPSSVMHAISVIQTQHG